MNDSYRLVCQLAAQLQTEGKTPSLALIRARAGKGIDAVALFSAYQQWRSHSPSHQETQVNLDGETSASNSTSQATNAACTSVIPTTDIHILQQDIQRLEQKVDTLSKLIEQLLQQSQS